MFGRKRYRSLALTTLLTTYVLIAAGASVRGLDAGMGCPDWPKCYGAWFPPSSEESLPENYAALYLSLRKQKNEKIANILHRMGFKTLAKTLSSSKIALRSERFSASKAYIEYINRFIGVLAGALSLLCVVYSFVLSSSALRKWSIIACAGMVLQGFLGAWVVSSHLIPFIVTWHMLLAFLILAALHMLYWKSGAGISRTISFKHPLWKAFMWLLWVGAIGFIAQVLLGTAVREGVDAGWMKTGFKRIPEGWIFYLHRSLSIPIAISLIFCAWWARKIPLCATLRRITGLHIGLCLLQVIIGVSMFYWRLSPFLQPFHLLIAFGMFACWLYLFYVIGHSGKLRGIFSS